MESNRRGYFFFQTRQRKVRPLQTKFGKVYVGREATFIIGGYSRADDKRHVPIAAPNRSLSEECSRSG